MCAHMRIAHTHAFKKYIKNLVFEVKNRYFEFDVIMFSANDRYLIVKNRNKNRCRIVFLIQISDKQTLKKKNNNNNED